MVISSPSISIRFWGVRGSIPSPGPDTIRYGGNTCCVEVRCAESVLIFDAGSGLRPLGDALRKDGKIGDTDLFLSHGHLDHVMGLPFFAPLLKRGERLRVWGGSFQAIGGVKAACAALMSHPLFPIDLEMLSGSIEFNDFRAGDTLEPRPDVRIRTAPLRHPGGAIGYRLEYAGRALAYVTDTEKADGSYDAGILALAESADLVIVDATYTDDELPAHRGWGHSSWQQGVELATAAGAKRLCLFHHDPARDDERMDAIAAAAEAQLPGAIVAREGLHIEL
jgi:phosphoribosyl 1,2-cyclic phosphodiesterase